jgi:hypothetical protein
MELLLPKATREKEFIKTLKGGEMTQTLYAHMNKINK